MSTFLNRRPDGSLALFIDGDLQFDEHDERIYHGGLAGPALKLAEKRLQTKADKQDSNLGLKALIIGGGDGLTARELLASDKIDTIDLVDYDPEVLGLAKAELSQLNGDSLSNGRTTVHVTDAWQYVQNCQSANKQYDLIIIDLTVAKDAAGAKFHSVEWYRSIAALLGEAGVLASNAVSPSATPSAYWSIFNAMRTAGLDSRPYRVTIPSFSALGYGPDWGFLLASSKQNTISAQDVIDFEHLFLFPLGFEKIQTIAIPEQHANSIFLAYLETDSPLVNSTTAVDSTAADCTVDGDSNYGLTNENRLWNALTANYDEMPEVVEKLATTADQSKREQELFDDVISLMPGLQPQRTKLLLSRFMVDPATFLEALDLKSLVDALLKRASELPLRIVNELNLLKEKLVDWSGDWETLLNLGKRVITTLAVVVILANFIFPDSAYGKGGGGGGGHEGGRGGGGRGDGGRGGDRGGRGGDRGDGRGGDRGDGRGDRGFDRGNRGWNGGWGRDRGHWGGWARADHWNHWGYHGWGGGWGG
ncbi:MAG: hypothetical protein WCT03_08975, partial [Candidatus Obscuribacterales bacterium]